MPKTLSMIGMSMERILEFDEAVMDYLKPNPESQTST